MADFWAYLFLAVAWASTAAFLAFAIYILWHAAKTFVRRRKRGGRK